MKLQSSKDAVAEWDGFYVQLITNDHIRSVVSFVCTFKKWAFTIRAHFRNFKVIIKEVLKANPSSRLALLIGEHNRTSGELPLPFPELVGNNKFKNAVEMAMACLVLRKAVQQPEQFSEYEQIKARNLDTVLDERTIKKVLKWIDINRDFGYQ